MGETVDKVDFSDWSIEDQKKLLSTVLEICGRGKQKSFRAAAKSFKWEDVKLDGKSAEDCMAMYQHLISKVRKYRTMEEIISDAITLVGLDKPINEFPDMPKKPLNAFNLFIRKRCKKFPEIKGTDRMKIFANDWNELSEEKKEFYRKKYMKLKMKYLKKLEEFRQNHPECPVTGAAVSNRPQPPLPIKLFLESRLENFKAKHPELSNADAVKKLTSKYKDLSDRKKLKWINKAKECLPNYQAHCETYLANNPKTTFKPVVFHLTKEEQRIWDSSKGKPVNVPPKNLFTYFCQTRRDSFSSLRLSEQSKELSSIYHKLSEDELQDLKKQFTKDIEEYIQSYKQYYQSLSEEERNAEKSPEEALALYTKILQSDSKKKKKKAAKENSLESNKKKRKLSEILPPISNDSDMSDNNSDDSSSSSIETSGKRKSQQPDVPSTPSKKQKTNNENETQLSTSKISNSTDALLSMWSPLKSKLSQSEESNSDQAKTKSPKKSKK